MDERAELMEMLQETEDLAGYDLYVWGTGNTAMLYQEGLSRLESEGIIVKGYVDNNADKWGESFNGERIFSPDELKKMDNVLVLILTPQPQIIKAVKEQLNDMHIKWRLMDDFILKGHSDEVLKCYDLFEDRKSKETYAELVRCRLLGRYPLEKIVEKEQYFSIRQFSEADANEIFVDCGAYVGDTVERYIWKKEGVFGKIIAFEPDMRNYNAMQHRVERLKKEWNLEDDKIMVYPYGVSDENAVSYIDRYSVNNGFGSKLLGDAVGGQKDVKS